MEPKWSPKEAKMEAKSEKNRSKIEVKFQVDFGCDFGCDLDIKSPPPAECAEPSNKGVPREQWCHVMMHLQHEKW